jgi:DNA-binding MarR family transcriptional regulator
MMDTLFANIARLGIKMRIFRAIQSADSQAGELKDREILILELLKIQGSMSMTQLSHFFPGVNLSTLSMDVKRLRNLDLIDVKVDKNDMRIHLIELSDNGLEKVAEIRAQRAKSYIPLAAAIGKKPEDLQVLNKVVEKAIVLVEKEINHFAESKKLTGPSNDAVARAQEYV